MFEYLTGCDREMVDELNALVTATLKKSKPSKPAHVCRDMALCFHDGQRIRHHKTLSSPWIATYNAETNTLLYEGTHYPSLSKFALEHIRTEVPERPSVDGWLVCEVEIAPDMWISTKALQPINVLEV